jgi:hypothetical protein
MSLVVIKTKNSLSVSNGFEQFIVGLDNINIELIIKAINENNFEEAKSLASLVNYVSKEIGGSGYEVNGVPINRYVVNKINELKLLGISYQPLLNFMERLSNNPSRKVFEQLFSFLEYGNMPISEDGYFYAYKKVRHDYFDIFSGTVDHSIGSKPEMKRVLCDDDPNVTCSTGLHFCSKDYLKSYSRSESDRVVVVKVDPADVVAVPVDYNKTKVRCCRYEVIADITDEYYSLGLEDRYVWSDDDFDKNNEGNEKDGYEDDDCELDGDCELDDDSDSESSVVELSLLSLSSEDICAMSSTDIVNVLSGLMLLSSISGEEKKQAILDKVNEIRTTYINK